MAEWAYVVRGYYTADVAPPKQPGGLASETVHRDLVSRNMEMEILGARTDIGEVDVLSWEAAGCPRPRRAR